MPNLLLERYMDRVARGQLERDPAQEQVLRGLEKLGRELAFYRPARKSAALGWLVGARAAAPRGAYIWGSVGRGKTMLM
ncbi:MAG: AFG1/ZapE family ATPase, partial [Methylovirgula sp.]